jgi:hypothetical protein
MKLPIVSWKDVGQVLGKLGMSLTVNEAVTESM